MNGSCDPQNRVTHRVLLRRDTSDLGHQASCVATSAYIRAGHPLDGTRLRTTGELGDVGQLLQLWREASISST